MENLVFLKLKRRNKNIYYHKNKYECDFIIAQKQRVDTVFQVSEKIINDNEKREINGLIEAMNRYKLNNGIILTLGQYEERNLNKKRVKIIPIWL